MQLVAHNLEGVHKVIALISDHRVRFKFQFGSYFFSLLCKVRI